MDAAAGAGLGERLEVRLDGRHLRDRAPDLPLDLVGDGVGLLEREIAGQLEMQGHLCAVVGSQHRQVVDLAHPRDTLRRSEDAFAQHGLAALGLDVDDDVAQRERLVDRRLDRVGGGVALRDRGSRRHADHDVRELPPRRLAHPETPQLNRRLDARDRRPRGFLRLGGDAIHEDVDVVAHQPRCGREHQHGHEQRRHRVSLLPARVDAEEPEKHCGRAGEVACKVERVRPERGALVAAGSPERNEQATGVDEHHEDDHDERVPLRMHRGGREPREVRDRPPGDQQARADEDRSLRERAEVLGLAVPVGVAGIGGPCGHADGEVREQRRDEVGARVKRLRDQAEAVRRDADDQLDGDQDARRDHRDEGGSPLRAHGRSIAFFALATTRRVAAAR